MMEHKMNSMKYLIVICIVIMLGSCTGKRNGNNEAMDSVALKSKLSDDNLNGTFEYSQPADKGFIRIVIKMKKSNDSLSGNFLSGLYMKKSETGEYSEPAALAECKIKGLIRKKKIIEMQMKLTKDDRLQKDAPDLLGMLNISKDVTTVWIFTLEDGTLVSQNGTVTPDGTIARYFWKKVN
jgi:hypothetical protein